jgi:hypothetical protein
MGNNREAGVASPDGMVVFRFGRGRRTAALLNRPGLRFHLGFIDGRVDSEAGHRRAAAVIERIVNAPSP